MQKQKQYGVNLSSKISYLQAFIQFYRQAKTIRKVKHPFIKSFAQAIVEDKRTFYCFPLIDLYRHDLLEDKQVLPSIDYGAPSKTQNRMKNKRLEICQAKIFNAMGIL